MLMEDKMTESCSKKVKERFATPVVEIVVFESNDIIKTSGGFSGDDDPAIPPDNF